MDSPKSYRKKRTKNFLPEEDDRIYVLVNDFKDIVECKQTNSKMIHQKNKAWISIAEKFNASSFVTRRTADELRKHFTVMKCKNRLEDVEARVLRIIDVEGRPDSPKLDDSPKFGGSIKDIIKKQVGPWKTTNSVFGVDVGLPLVLPLREIPEIDVTDEEEDGSLSHKCSTNSNSSETIPEERKIPTTVPPNPKKIKASCSDAIRDYFLQRTMIEKEQLKLLEESMNEKKKRKSAEELRNVEKHILELQILRAQLRKSEKDSER